MLRTFALGLGAVGAVALFEIWPTPVLPSVGFALAMVLFWSIEQQRRYRANVLAPPLRAEIRRRAAERRRERAALPPTLRRFYRFEHEPLPPDLIRHVPSLLRRWLKM